MNSDCQLLVFSGLAIFLWGLWGFFGKLALDKGMEPTTLFLAEVVISFVCVLPVLIMILHKKEFFRQTVYWNIFGLVSGAALALGLLFYYLALQKGQVSLVVPLTATYPIISVLLGYVALNEKPSLFQWIGIFLVVSGAALLLSGPAGDTKAEAKADETITITPVP